MGRIAMEFGGQGFEFMEYIRTDIHGSLLDLHFLHVIDLPEEINRFTLSFQPSVLSS